MKITDIGEFDFIERISSHMKQPLPIGITGIGDDCAVIAETNERSLLITTDALVEDTHFLKDQIKAKDLGHKLLAINLSDIAAMGAIPHSAFLTMCLPTDLEIEWIDDFILGFKKIAERYNVLLLGGDTTQSPQKIFMNLSVLGHAHPNQIKYRSTAKSGDLICVTDNLGDSGGGLNIVLQKLEYFLNKSPESSAHAQHLLHRHYLPEPCIEQGKFLAQQSVVHAMMDLSDGLHSDIQRIMKSSNCGAVLFMDKFPISAPLERTSQQLGWNARELAATGGEDYALLFTADPSHFAQLAETYFNKFNQKIYPVGEITTELNKLQYLMNGKPVSISKKEFRHFG
jgi:thiamine-monophosphate kinase